jgi:hypothetical protein
VSGSHLTGVQASIPSSVATSADLAAANARITSVSDFAVALSATFATSISNYLPLAGGTLTGNAIVSVTDNTNAALRITQLGTGNALLVEDSANPDSTPFVITAAGDVGIGTTAPSQKLEVAGNILANGGSISIGTGGLYQAGSIFSDASWGMLFRAKQASPSQADFRWANSADTERMRITSAGNVGIGTSSPAVKLDVSGVAKATALSLSGTTAFSAGTISLDSNWGMYFRAAGNSSLAEFAWVNKDSVERMRITNAGNVGIGTAFSKSASNSKRQHCPCWWREHVQQCHLLDVQHCGW